jgi:integrase/recombinase XerD
VATGGGRRCVRCARCSPICGVGGFLDHLEAERGNSVTNRNARLAAIHSLFRYTALRCPEHALLIQRMLVIPTVRYTTTDMCHLTLAETDALLAVPTTPALSVGATT